MEVLKLCVVQGVQACNLGVPILSHELIAFENRKRFRQASESSKYGT